MCREVCRQSGGWWVHLPLGESCFWTQRPRSSSWKGGRQGPQAPDPGGQNSRRCRAQSKLRGHDAAVGTGENSSGGGEGSNAPRSVHGLLEWDPAALGCPWLLLLQLPAIDGLHHSHPLDPTLPPQSHYWLQLTTSLMTKELDSMIFMGPFQLEIVCDFKTCTRHAVPILPQGSPAPGCHHPVGHPMGVLQDTLSSAELAVTRISCPCLPCMGRRNPTGTDRCSCGDCQTKSPKPTPPKPQRSVTVLAPALRLPSLQHSLEEAVGRQPSLALHRTAPQTSLTVS